MLPGGLLGVGSLPVLVTSVLALATIGSATIAYLVYRERRGGDLVQMHREIDRTRGLVREGLLDERDRQAHLARLHELQRSLPKDDLRRK